MIPIYDPRVAPKLRCAVDRLSLAPGEYGLIQNLRTDQQSLIARLPDAVINASPPSGALSTAGVYFPMGDFQGFPNGTATYLSAWQMTDGTTAVFSQNLTTGAYTEITNAGNASASTWGGTTTGATRFPTPGANVNYCVVTTPRRVYQGSTLPTVDVVIIQNGSDQAIVYNSGSGYAAQAQVMWSPDSITLPSQPDIFNSLVSFSAFWEVRGNSKTYYASAGPPRINQTNFKMADSTTVYGVSDATLRVVNLTLGTSPNSGDIATVQFPVSGVTNQESFEGKWLNTFWQASSDDLTEIFKDTKVELGKQSVGYTSVTTWTTIYDPTSTDPVISTFPTLVAVDPGNNRYLIPFLIQNISTLANRTAYHLRLTRTSAFAPTGGALSAFLLAVTSTGAGGGFPYGMEWTASYYDRYTLAESPPFVQTATNVDSLYDVGGPRGPDASSTTPIMLPRNTTVWYDYRLHVKMPDSNTAIQGGLNGQPSDVNLYFRDPATETTPFYWSSWQIWQPVHTSTYNWTSNAQSGAGGTETLRTEQAQIYSTQPDGCGFGVFGQVDYAQRDPGVPAPNDFAQCMPRSSVIGSALGRLFCGNNKYPSSVSAPQELKFSDYGFFGRFRSVQDVTDPNSAGRLTFDGETIKQFKTCAAAAQGAVVPYVWTDASFNALGTAGGYVFAASEFNGYNLEQRYRISADGTFEPGSVLERNGVLAWINTEGHFVRTDGGTPVNISVFRVTNPQGVSNSSVTDIIADIPSSRRGTVRGVAAHRRFYWFMTPSGSTVNSRCAIYDQWRDLWESLDTLTSGQQACKVYDSSQNGSGERVLLHGADGKTYGYEEGSGTVAARLTTGGYLATDLGAKKGRGYGYIIKECELMCEVDTGNTMTISVYRNMNPAATPYTFPFALDSGANDEWLVRFSVGTGTAVEGWGQYFDVTSTITGGKKISSLTAAEEIGTADNRPQG